MELCRDQPFHGLVHEVGQINESVNLLNMKVIKFPLARINLMKLRTMIFQLQTIYIHAPTVYKLQLNSAEAANQDLLRNKARLEHDLAIKSNSLHIDREGCVATRKTFPVVSLATKL